MTNLYRHCRSLAQKVQAMAIPLAGNRLNVAVRSLASLAKSLLATAFLLAFSPAQALDLSALTNSDASAGVRAALEKGSDVAVAKLGVDNGFLGNPKVRIPLPDGLKQAEKVMKLMGRQQQFDDLVVSINRAAEQAIPLAKPLLTSAIKSMSLADAKSILAGGDDSVTRFFQQKTETSLSAKFLPIVKETTDKVGLARQYNTLAGQAATFGAVKGNEAKIESYVAAKAMNGLYLMIAEEERAIRKDPVGSGSALLKKVFGGRDGGLLSR